MFTGDRSGDFLYAALHRAGLASAPRSVARDDGLALAGAFITAAARCAPPDNRPSPEELARCAPFLDAELSLLDRTGAAPPLRQQSRRGPTPSRRDGIRVYLALGAIAWDAVLGHLARLGRALPRPRPRFGHGAEWSIPGVPALLGSYHPSQQNTSTGRLTPAMLDAVLRRAVELAGLARSP